MNKHKLGFVFALIAFTTAPIVIAAGVGLFILRIGQFALDAGVISVPFGYVIASANIVWVMFFFHVIEIKAEQLFARYELESENKNS